MKWNKSDMSTYIKAKEYIDTVIVPVIPFQTSKDEELIKDAHAQEVMTFFVHHLEKELSGRIMLAPSYVYLKSSELDEEIKRINAWVDDIQSQPFQHIFFITYDPKWKKYEKEMKGNLLWLPALQSEEIDVTEPRGIIHEQVNQVVELIRSFW